MDVRPSHQRSTEDTGNSVSFVVSNREHLFCSLIEEKWTLEIELVIDDELDSDDDNSPTLVQSQVDDNTNSTHVTLKLQDIMKCHVVLARCSVMIVIDGMSFITIVSIFSDRRTPPIAERQQRALLLVAYL